MVNGNNMRHRAALGQLMPQPVGLGAFDGMGDARVQQEQAQVIAKIQARIPAFSRQGKKGVKALRVGGTLVPGPDHLVVPNGDQQGNQPPVRRARIRLPGIEIIIPSLHPLRGLAAAGVGQVSANNHKGRIELARQPVHRVHPVALVVSVAPVDKANRGNQRGRQRAEPEGLFPGQKAKLVIRPGRQAREFHGVNRALGLGKRMALPLRLGPVPGSAGAVIGFGPGFAHRLPVDDHGPGRIAFPGQE